MAAPVVGSLINFVNQQLRVAVWDGEVPRYDQSGRAVTPQAAPDEWPAVKVFMPETGFDRSLTFEDPYSDRGEILCQVWGTSRTQTELVHGLLEVLLSRATSWALIPLAGGESTNPFRIIQILVRNWNSIQETALTGKKTSRGEYLYRADLHLVVEIHGAVPSV